MISKYKIGFHARNMEELERVITIDSVNLVELKPKYFNNSKFPLYFFDGKKFTSNKDVFSSIKQMCDDKNVQVQIHVVYETKIDPLVEEGLCQAKRSHHELLLQKYEMFGEIYKEFGIGNVLTVHPPLITEYFDEEETIAVGSEFYFKLDKLLKEKKYGLKIGIENMIAPKTEIANNVGYKPWHIDKLIGKTSEIGITIDSGHRRLNDLMSMSELFRYAPIVNAHFHSNKGIINKDNFKDDEHIFATPDNLENYYVYIKSFKRFKIPVILEIYALDNYHDNELKDYIQNLKREIESSD